MITPETAVAATIIAIGVVAVAVSHYLDRKGSHG